MGGRGSRFSVRPQRKGLKKTSSLSNQEPTSLKEALGTKGKAFSIGESATEANPNYNVSYAEYSENCQRCVVAYEARRRGYDVEALPTYLNDQLPKIAYYVSKLGVFQGRWQGAFQHAKGEDVSATTRKENTPDAEKEVISNIESKMKGYGNGSRAVVQIFYRGGGGHVFNVENQNGRIVYIEAQKGEMKDIVSTMHIVQTHAVALVRTDNLKFSERARKSIHQKK